jgi:cysteine desulfurase
MKRFSVRIYLDFNATAPAAPGVIDAVCRVLRDIPGNPSSIHASGQQARAVLDDARGVVATLIEAAPSDLVFTGGGTEADNLALRGAAEARESSGRRHLICSSIEHEAVLNTLTGLERRGWRVTRLPVDRSGSVSPTSLASAIDEETALVSVMHANNEIGTLQPIAELADIAHSVGAWFHTDAVQTVGKVPVSVRTLGVDLLSLSGHKFGGPKGTGALWVRRGLRLHAQHTGGRQERSRRGGTENVAGLAGLAVAAAYARASMAQHASETARLRDRLESAILETVPGSAVNGAREHRVPNTTNISFDGVEAESLLIALDLDGIAVSTGSACSSGTLEPSHVLQAMGLPAAHVRSSLRFSLGPQTTDAEVDAVVDRLPRLVEKLRRLTHRATHLVGAGAPTRGTTRDAVRGDT